MVIFVIESKIVNGYEVPAQDFCYTAIEAVNYRNWYEQEQVYDFVLCSSINGFRNLDHNYLTPNHVPIGSVDFVLHWFKCMGIKKIKPLNIPPALWKFCDRQIMLEFFQRAGTGKWMCKDPDHFKSHMDRPIILHDGQGYSDKAYFLTEWIPDVDSEWRCFVHKGKLQGIRCYSGDEWALPDKEYIQTVIDAYTDKGTYTLDVMVYGESNGKGNHTEILELHDFFSCGLYGFDDYSVLPSMWISTVRDILATKSK